ncbi:MAG: MFS transporter [Chloroflexi bacterium]|nr:MFS transporter [Chloroflexota bacterium]
MVVVSIALFTDAFIYGLVIPLAARSPVAGGDASTVAVSYAAYGFGVLLATPIVGRLTDQAGRRLPLLLGFACLSLATVLFGVADSMPILLLARTVQGFASTATWTAGLALVADAFVRNRTQKMGIALMASSAGSVLGPVVGGALLEFSGSTWPFIVGGGLLIVDGVLRTSLVVERPRAGTPALNARGLVRERDVLAAILVVLLGAAGWSLVEPLLPEHLARAGAVGPAVIGLMFTVSTLANGLSAPWIGAVAERCGLWPTMLAGLVLLALALPLLALPVSIVAITGILMLVNVAYGVAMNPSLSELADAVDRRGISAYGAVYALYNVGYAAGQMGGNLLGGLVATSVSFLGALVLTSMLLLVSVPLIYFIHLRPLRHAAAASHPMRERTEA